MQQSALNRRFRHRYRGTAIIGTSIDLARYILDAENGYHTSIHLSGSAFWHRDLLKDIPILLHERLETLELESIQHSRFENNDEKELFLRSLVQHRRIINLELYGGLPPVKLSTLVDGCRVGLALRTIFLSTVFLSAQQLLLFGKILKTNQVLKKVTLEFIEFDLRGGLSQLMLSYGKSAVHRLQIGVQQLSAHEIFCLGQAINARNAEDGQEPRRFELVVDFIRRDFSNLGTSALRRCLAAIAKSAKYCDFLNLVNSFNGINKEIEKAYFLQVLREVGLLAKNRRVD